MSFTLVIGGYRIAFHESCGYPCLFWPIRPFESFLDTSADNADIAVHVEVVPHLPELESTRLHYDSNHGHWTLSHSTDGFVLDSRSPKTDCSRARACLSTDYRRIHAWILPELQNGQVGWSPMHLFNPIVEVCLLSRLALDGGLLLHSSGLVYGGRGFAFTGASGAGKSTLAGRFAERNALVLSDERVVLRRTDEGIRLFGTPWIGSGEHAANESASLSKLCCIRHGQETHRLTPLTPSRTVSFLLQQTFLPHWDRACLEAVMDSLVALTQRVPCYELAFLNTADVVDVVADHALPNPLLAAR
ncbi:MAG: hypothetical protein U0412_15075 [Nitrospira sp.]